MLGLCHCTRLFLVTVNRGCFLAAAPHYSALLLLFWAHLKGTWASVAVARELSTWGLLALSTGSIAVVHGLSCSVACEIFLVQGLNPCFCIGEQTYHWATREALILGFRSFIAFSSSWSLCPLVSPRFRLSPRNERYWRLCCSCLSLPQKSLI